MNVKLIVRNALGQEIKVLEDGFLNPGRYVRTFDARDLSSGVYYYSLITSKGMISKKMILAK
jgi:hypothetical protein